MINSHQTDDEDCLKLHQDSNDDIDFRCTYDGDVLDAPSLSWRLILAATAELSHLLHYQRDLP